MSDAVRLLSAIGDVLGTQPAGFGMRVGEVAARFERHRGADVEQIAAVYYAGALHYVGAVACTAAAAHTRDSTIAAWEIPVAGARLVAAIPGLPSAAADNVRWHRESFDGTGFPDRLRWNGIPRAAMSINVARGFIAALNAQGGAASAPEALFAIMSESGRRYDVEAVRVFREFVAAAGGALDEPFEPEWPLDDAAADAVVSTMCAHIDARHAQRPGRGDRLERLVRAIAPNVHLEIDADGTAFAARLTALTRLGAGARADDFDPLARLGRDARAAAAAEAARILRAAPGYAAYADLVGAIAEWYDGSGLPMHRKGDAIPAAARVVAVALAAEALEGSTYTDAAHGFPDAAARIAAAAGTQFDPAVVEGYVRAAGSAARAGEGQASA